MLFMVKISDQSIKCLLHVMFKNSAIAFQVKSCMKLQCYFIPTIKWHSIVDVHTEDIKLPTDICEIISCLCCIGNFLRSYQDLQNIIYTIEMVTIKLLRKYFFLSSDIFMRNSRITFFRPKQIFNTPLTYNSNNVIFR